ncbi:MAG: hypothetical protein ABI452_01880, partial [Candidatus Limnocylindrales bacterium]
MSIGRGSGPGTGGALRIYRSLFVLVVLIVSLVVAYLPGQPGPVSAENGGPPTSTLEPIASDPPVQPDPTAEPTAQPTADPTAQPTTDPTTQPTTDPTTDPAAEPTLTPSPVPTATAEPSVGPLLIEGFAFARVARPEDAVYLAAGAPLTNEPRFEVFRLRFDVINASAADGTWQPQLEFGAADGAAFELLAADTG